MHVFSALVADNIADGENCISADNGAVVGFLATHLRIENRTVKNKNTVISVIQIGNLFAFRDDSKDFTFCRFRVITDKFGIGDFFTELYACPAEIAQSLARFSSIRVWKASSSTVMPSSAHISIVRSSGKPKVS